MLVKKRLSFFLFSFLFMTGFFSGYWLSGVGLILISVMMLFGARLAIKGWLGWGGGGLVFVGILVTMLGFILNR